MIEPIVLMFGLICSSFFGTVIVYTGFALTRAVFVKEK